MPRKMDELLVPVQRCVLLLPVQVQVDLPSVNEELHICEDSLRVPQVFKPDSLSVEPNPSPPTGPTVPLTPEHISLNHINMMAHHPDKVEHQPEFLCWECDMRDMAGPALMRARIFKIISVTTSWNYSLLPSFW